MERLLPTERLLAHLFGYVGLAENVPHDPVDAGAGPRHPCGGGEAAAPVCDPAGQPVTHTCHLAPDPEHPAHRRSASPLSCRMLVFVPTLDRLELEARSEHRDDQ